MALHETALVNGALSRLGINPGLTVTGAGTLAENTESSAERRAAETWFAVSRDRMLERVSFTKARGYVQLAALSPLPDPLPWANEYEYAYVYPAAASVLKIWRVVSGRGSWELSAEKYTVRVHDGALVVLTNSAIVDPYLEVQLKITDVTLFTPLMDEALEWALAAAFSSTLAVDAGLAQLAYQMAEQSMAAAHASQLNEDENPRTKDGSYVQVRRGGGSGVWGYGGHPIVLP